MRMLRKDLMREEDPCVDPFGVVVSEDVAFRRWRRVATVIRRELGLGQLRGFSIPPEGLPGFSFWIERDCSMEVPKALYLPLYRLCLEAQRLRRRARVERAPALQAFVDRRRLIEHQDRMQAQIERLHEDLRLAYIDGDVRHRKMLRSKLKQAKKRLWATVAQIQQGT